MLVVPRLVLRPKRLEASEKVNAALVEKVPVPTPLALTVAFRVVELPAPREATLLSNPLALLAARSTRSPEALESVTLLVETTLPVYPTIQLERYRFVEPRLAEAWS